MGVEYRHAALSICAGKNDAASVREMLYLIFVSPKPVLTSPVRGECRATLSAHPVRGAAMGFENQKVGRTKLRPREAHHRPHVEEGHHCVVCSDCGGPRGVGAEHLSRELLGAPCDHDRGRGRRSLGHVKAARRARQPAQLGLTSRGHSPARQRASLPGGRTAQARSVSSRAVWLGPAHLVTTVRVVTDQPCRPV